MFRKYSTQSLIVFTLKWVFTICSQMLIFLHQPISIRGIFTHDCTHLSAGHNIHRIPAVRLPAAAADHSPHPVLGQFQWGAHPIRNPPQPSVYVTNIYNHNNTYSTAKELLYFKYCTLLYFADSIILVSCIFSSLVVAKSARECHFLSQV